MLMQTRTSKEAARRCVAAAANHGCHCFVSMPFLNLISHLAATSHQQALTLQYHCALHIALCLHPSRATTATNPPMLPETPLIRCPAFLLFPSLIPLIDPLREFHFNRLVHPSVVSIRGPPRFSDPTTVTDQIFASMYFCLLSPAFPHHCELLPFDMRCRSGEDQPSRMPRYGLVARLDDAVTKDRSPLVLHFGTIASSRVVEQLNVETYRTERDRRRGKRHRPS